MKKFLIAIAALTTVAATPAFAQSSVTYDLNASVASICGITGESTNIAVSFGTLATTPSSTELRVGGSTPAYRCNSPVGFTRTISSVNNGKLVRVGSNGDAANSIPFTMDHGGYSGLAFTAASLLVNKVDTINASADILYGQTGSVFFNVKGVATSNTERSAPGTTVYAGTYSDTVTISVTAL